MIEDYKPKPRTYNKFKKFFAKNFFVIKRKIKWLFDNKIYSKQIATSKLKVEIFSHKSFLLRRLKDVDMYLQENKTVNLQIAIKNINGIIIKPNETFSLWKLVGNPTRQKGYLEGLILTNGKISKGTGGGLCQLGNLLYWMVLHSPLEITERWRHSYDVFPDVNRKIPFGSGATLSYNYVDLQIFNPTNQDFQLNLWLTEKYLQGSINSSLKIKQKYEVFEKNHRIVHQWWGGYTRHNQIFRKIISENGSEKEELVTQNHAVMMYNPMLQE